MGHQVIIGGKSNPEREKVLEVLQAQHDQRRSRALTEKRSYELMELGREMQQLEWAMKVVREIPWLE